MSIVRPASASRLVIPMSAAVLAVGESGLVWIPNNAPSDGTSRPVGRTGIGSGGVGAGGSTYGTVCDGVVAIAAGDDGTTPSTGAAPKTAIMVASQRRCSTLVIFRTPRGTNVGAGATTSKGGTSRSQFLAPRPLAFFTTFRRRSAS